MKKIILGWVLLSLGLMAPTAKAQVSVNVNIGTQPVWGPVGYDYVDYYYLPDIGVYYNVPSRQFIYLDAGRWLFATSLPYHYRNYDLYRGYKVVVNRPNAYRYWNEDRVRYSNYRNWSGQRQVIIRDRPNYRNSSPRVVYRTKPNKVVYKNQYNRMVYNDRKNNDYHKSFDRDRSYDRDRLYDRNSSFNYKRNTERSIQRNNTPGSRSSSYSKASYTNYRGNGNADRARGNGNGNRGRR